MTAVVICEGLIITGLHCLDKFGCTVPVGVTAFMTAAAFGNIHIALAFPLQPAGNSPVSLISCVSVILAAAAAKRLIRGRVCKG